MLSELFGKRKHIAIVAPFLLAVVFAAPADEASFVVRDAIERALGRDSLSGALPPSEMPLVVDVRTSLEVVGAAGLNASNADTTLARPRFIHSTPLPGDATFCTPGIEHDGRLVSRVVCGLSRDVEYVTICTSRLDTDTLRVSVCSYTRYRLSEGVAARGQEVVFARVGPGVWRYVRLGLGVRGGD